jgi:hypothetical protein
LRVGDRDELEAALARVTGLEDEIERLHAANAALEATLARAVTGGDVDPPRLAASPAPPGAAHGDAYRDELAAAETRARSLDEELAELRRTNTALATLVAADAAGRAQRERNRRIEAADQREAEAALELARREHDRLARRTALVAAGLVLGGAVGFAGAPAAGAVVGVIALLCTLALLMAR